MEFTYKEQLPADFSPASRVWIYQCNRPFSEAESIQVQHLLNQFVQSWLSHGDPVKGFGQLFFKQFVVLMADEAATGVSGCSTDSSVRLIKQIETGFGVTMFDRQTLAFVIDNKVQLIPMLQLKTAVAGNLLTADTIYFNNLVATKTELDEKWLQPVKDSWLAGRLNLESSVGSR